MTASNSITVGSFPEMRLGTTEFRRATRCCAKLLLLRDSIFLCKASEISGQAKDDPDNPEDAERDERSREQWPAPLLRDPYSRMSVIPELLPVNLPTLNQRLLQVVCRKQRNP